MGRIPGAGAPGDGLTFLSKHLPPSAGQPRVLALDAASASILAAEAGSDLDLIGPTVVRFDPAALPFRPSAFDSVAFGRKEGRRSLTALLSLLRPGGRLIALVTEAERSGWLEELERAGFIHLYAEAVEGQVLLRGERPPEKIRSVDRIAAVAGGAAGAGGLGRYVHLLVAQTPNKPAWRLTLEDRLEWQVAIAAAPGLPAVTPAFTSLVRAVRFMQAAVLAGTLRGVNKVGKFPAAVAREWPFGLVLDAGYDEWRAGPWAASAWQWQVIDYQAAVREEG